MSDDNLESGSLSITRHPVSGLARMAASAGDGPGVYTASAAVGTESFANQGCDTLGACDSAGATVAVGTSHYTISGTGM